MEKIGRNDPCPCGSGKKFKNCHLGKEADIIQDGMGEISFEMSSKITGLPSVSYGRSQEMIDALDIKTLTGVATGIKFIDLKKYRELDMFGRASSNEKQDGTGAVIVNVLKTGKSDQDNIYIAISPNIEAGTLAHQLAHVLDYLGGSKLMPGMAKPLSFELGIPTEHLEHPHEFASRLDMLQKKFKVRIDADDAIILFLFKNDMLLKGEDIENQDQFIIKSKSERILKFLGENSAEIDKLICELPGYIGSRVGKN